MKKNAFVYVILAGISLLLLPATSQAERIKVKITKEIPYVVIDYQGKKIKIMRNQDQNHVITGGFAKTSRPCPPFCFQPEKVTDEVETIGEVELVRFLKNEYSRGNGLLVDARVPSWYHKGTIPGSINVPFPTFSDDNVRDLHPDLLAAMELFGVRKKTSAEMEKGDGFFSRLFGSKDTKDWDFSKAKPLVLFCNGPWCGQSPTAIRALLKLGYPPEKLKYYRGGMQMWQMGGLTTVLPEKEDE